MHHRLIGAQMLSRTQAKMSTHCDSAGNAAISLPHATQDAETHSNLLLYTQRNIFIKHYYQYFRSMFKKSKQPDK